MSFKIIKLFMLILSLVTSMETFSQEQIPDVTFPISGGSFIYHPERKALLLAGGSSIIPDSVQSDVWKWDGKNWSKIIAKGPGSRDFFKGALNTKTGLLNFYAGMDASGKPKSDLWSFNGQKWTKVQTENIGTHDHHNMVYMDHLDAFLIYGGNINGYPNFDSATWLLKNGQFTKLDVPGPGPRWHHGMVYDKSRKKVMLYGGGEKPDEQWEFDGAKWTKIITSENPGMRLYHHMVYNEDSKTIILHGGWSNQNPRDPNNYSSRTTWEWNGATWKKIAEEPIHALSMSYDANRKVIVAYGYNGKPENSNLAIWEMTNNKWKKKIDYIKWSAFDIVKRRVEQDSNDFLALAKYADMLQWQTKQYTEAEAAYKKLEKAYPKKINMLKDLALVLSMQGKMEEAEKYITKVDQAGLMNRLSYLRLAGLLSNEKKYRESIKYQEKALSMEPRGGDYYNLACSYAHLGEKDKSFDDLNKAIEYGFNTRSQYENDKDLESLRSDNRWKDLLFKLK
jgi:tetratricopeptide (TPR) repeat protein